MASLATKRFGTLSITPSEEDQEMAVASSRRLAGLLTGPKRAKPALSFLQKGQDQPELVLLPAAAVPLIAQILAQLARGQAVTVIPVESELTTQQAADILGVSRPHLVQMLRDKKLHHRKVGSHRRIRFCDLKDFKATEDASRQKALDALAAQAQELDQGY